eukprot:751289-Hanusia_phi.AAC.4
MLVLQQAPNDVVPQGPPGDVGPKGPNGPPGPLGESVSRLCSSIEGKMYRGVCFKGALLEENADSVPGGPMSEVATATR